MAIGKVELHTHLEGTIPPTLVRQLAKKNGLTLKEGFISEDGRHFLWKDFLDFLDVYEQASSVIKTPEDYYTISFDYLKRSALDNVIYVEMMYSPEHAERASGIPSKEHVLALEAAIEDADDQFNITGRIITTGVRHYGIEACERVALEALENPSKFVIGFGLGGDEKGFPPGQFKRAYEIARAAGLGCTVHAGEMDGPKGVLEALDNLPVTRLGHGVRAIESTEVMATIAELGIHLELCPSSNIATGVFNTIECHPLRRLYDYGIQLSLNSDDPPYFNCSVASEYQIAEEVFNFSEKELKKISLMAIDAAFIEKPLKEKLIQQLHQN